MKESTKDQAEGTLHKVKGTIKEGLGKLCKNHGLEDEGKTEKISGTVQEKLGQIEKVVGK